MTPLPTPVLPRSHTGHARTPAQSTPSPKEVFTPEPFEALYSRIVEDRVLRHPRSLQTAIGPSELGEPCARKLLARLAGLKDPRQEVAWKTVIGTAVHSWMEDCFTEANGDNQNTPRFVTEWRVDVGEVGGRTVSGSCDLYDTLTHTVADHKCVGIKQIAKYRVDGPPEIYRRQINLYALGFLRDQGWGTPKRVAICFLPRDGEWGKRWVWEAPVDYPLAIDTLNRANQLAQLLATDGLEAAQARQELCDSPWCWACKPHHRDAEQSERTSLFL